jgi:transposase-like protein
MEAGLDDQLSYSRYDYKNKDTDNSRNGHSSKTLRTSFGDVEVSVPRDRKSEFDPKVLRKNQTGISRGVEDIFIACTDNLTGFSAAIEAVYPKTEIQNCIIHQLRNSSKYVSYKDLKALMADLKAVYAAVDEPAALDALDTFAEHWDKKYPKISQSWRDNWANLSTYFKFPQELRRLIYTTNTIEGFNRQLRKVTKSQSVFPTDDSLFKMLYLAMIDITKKWTGRRQDWSMIHAQLAIYFEDRMPG